MFLCRQFQAAGPTCETTRYKSGYVIDGVAGLAKVLCAYHGVPSPQNGCPALLLRVDDVVDVLCSDDDFWWEVSVSKCAS